MPRIRLVLPVLAVLAACLAVGAGTASAKTAKSEKAAKASKSKVACWKLLLNDYVGDGRIDGTYQKHCYTEAMNHLPEDQLLYGEARNDINRALLDAIAANRGKGGPPLGPNSMIPGEGKRKTQGGGKDESFWSRLASKLGPGNATSIPLPLMILAGLGLLLVAAAGASYAARRIAARRAAPAPATVPPEPRRK